jgi:hypothetical protein
VAWRVKEAPLFLFQHRLTIVRLVYHGESKWRFSMKWGIFEDSFTGEGCWWRVNDGGNFTLFPFIYRGFRVMVQHLKVK